MLLGAYSLLIILLLAPLTSSAQFITRGDAVKLSDQCFKITEDKEWRYGYIWWKEKIDLSEPLELEFTIYLGTKDLPGADGIVFLFHNDPRGLEARGRLGEAFGIGAPDPVSPSVAIEFDTHNNTNGSYIDNNTDITADHTTVFYNGNTAAPELPPVPIDPNNEDVENNQCHTYTIKWNPDTKELKLFFDGAERFTHKDDIVKNVFNGNSMVYYGFAGATGGLYNEQTICLQDLNSKPAANDDAAQAVPGKPVTVAVLENDTHTTGSPLTLTRIVKEPKNGTAVISGDKIVYTPSVWFQGNDVLTYYETSDAGSTQCYNKIATAQVIIDVACPSSLPPVELIATGNTAFCEGGSVILSALGQAADAKFTWKRNGLLIEGNKPELAATVAGEYAVNVETICGTVTSNTITVTTIPLPMVQAVTGSARCEPGTMTLTATGGEEGNYRWYNVAEGGVPFPDASSSTFTTPHLDATTTYYVSFIGGNGCESKRSPVQAVIVVLPDIDPYTEVAISRGQTIRLGKGNTTPGIRYEWSPATGLDDPYSATPRANPTETITYTVVATTPAGCQITGQVHVFVRRDIVVPNAFSPNGDGVNETWEVETLEDYPDARVEVFDRWGTRIYEKVRYINEWNGTYKGQPLPVSTYFYVITLSEDIPKHGKKIVGSVSIVH
ncbi:lectin-like domain-containing protein [Pontibacter diazotrophicus]|uniref:lectin-like domain-containing protein n=1 Tax=Pontibacter diazotrophicus TaxID=1400979 RepID=UPI0015F1A516|nr:gliding motility-associated C-terminal domain-containing protein [Pontibacter diazotrophicus]